MNIGCQVKQYGFQGDLSSEFPSQIIIDVTERCNLACLHCPHESFTKLKAFDGGCLDLSLHRKMVDELSAYGKKHCKYLRYTAQGETLLHPNLADMVRYAKINSGITINVTTNGTLMTSDTSFAMLDAGVDVIDISIDAYSDEVYRFIRRGGNLSVTRNNVLQLIKLIDKYGYSTKVMISFIEQPLNKGESKLFENFWNKMGADRVVMRPLHSAGGAVKDVASKMKEENINKRWPCRYPWERLMLNSKGEICYCPADWQYQANVALLRDTTIRDVWKGEYMNGLRKAHLTSDFSCHKFCGQCPDWITVKWPNQGRSYSNVMSEIVE